MTVEGGEYQHEEEVLGCNLEIKYCRRVEWRGVGRIETTGIGFGVLILLVLLIYILGKN